jgi:peptidoglycan/xylan/chitin deacetylase (PgdA/CDA1 family)
MEDPRYSTYSAIIDRPKLRWPGNARVAFWVSPNVEFYEYEPPPSSFRNQWPRVPHPDVLHYSYRDYGNRVGFWRMLEVFDQYKIRGSVSLNMAVLEHFPEIRDAMVARNWDYFTHGIYNTRYLFGMTPDEERAFYRDNIDTLYRQTGKRLKGMLGPAFSSTTNTPELMAEAGLTYQVDWFHDDQPFPLNVKSGKLISLPYTRELNDSVLFNAPSLEADYFAQICKDQFDAMYEEGVETGQVMCVSLHPFLIGQPHRLRYFAEIVDYVLSFEGVWNTTSDEIADYYLANCYDEVVAHLAGAPSARGRK